jgi:hypothetical protein
LFVKEISCFVLNHYYAVLSSSCPCSLGFELVSTQARAKETDYTKSESCSTSGMASVTIFNIDQSNDIQRTHFPRNGEQLDVEYKFSYADLQ